MSVLIEKNISNNKVYQAVNFQNDYKQSFKKYFCEKVSIFSAFHFSSDAVIRGESCLLKTHSVKKALLENIQCVLDDLQGLTVYKKENYDAHIGDCACQLRAFLLCDIFSYFGQAAYFYLNVHKDYLKKLQTTLSDFNIKKSDWHKGDSLVAYFESLGFEWKIDKFIYLLGIMRLLAKFSNISNDGVSSNFDLTCFERALDVPKKYAKKILLSMQKYVSQETCQYIVHCLSPGYDISQYIQFDLNNRSILPCFLTARIIMNHAKFMSIPLNIEMQNEMIKGSQALHASVVFDGSKWHLNNGFVRKGVCIQATDENRKDSVMPFLLNPGIDKLFLAYMAEHPQYSGLKNHESPYSDDLHNMLIHFCQKAREWGCCSSNRSLFFVNHVYYG